MNFELKKLSKNIICEGAVTDAVVETVANGNTLDLYLTATNDKVKFIELEWSFASGDGVYVLGDEWERSYEDIKNLLGNNGGLYNGKR